MSDDDQRAKTEDEMRHKPLSKEDAYFKKLEEERLRALAQKTETKRLCPVDGTQLVPEDNHGLVIDRCPKCRGVWMDEHEALLLRKGFEADPEENLLQRWMKNILPYQK